MTQFETAPSAGQREYINRLIDSVSSGRSFPTGQYNVDGYWLLNRPEMINCLRGNMSHGQQAKTRDFITRFVISLGLCPWSYIVNVYTDGEGEFSQPQPFRSFKRKRSTGAPVGRPRKYKGNNRRSTAIQLTIEQKTAIKWKYGTLQNFAEIGADYILGLYQQHQQEQQHEEIKN